MKKYKVRITKMPSNDVMAYGGQTNYGLDLGQRKIYTDMRKSPTDSASSTMTEKDDLGPDEDYRIVAENNETIVGDFDQSGELGFQTIKGDYHSAPSGGTYLTNKQAVDGAYIFPQTKSMYIKDKNFLEKLGIKFKKGGISPADASRKFDMMAEKKVLDDPNADNLSKNTAAMVKANKEQKLQMLAEYVEAMKGNPQGDPNIHKSLATAKYGGYMLPEAAMGYALPAEYVFAPVDPWLQSNTPQGKITPTKQVSTFQGSSNDYNQQWQPFVGDISKMKNADAQKLIYDWTLKNNPEEAIRVWKQYGLTNKGKRDPKLMAMTAKDAKGMPTGKFADDFNFTPEVLQQLQGAYVDNYWGDRKLNPKQKPPDEIPGPKPTPRVKFKCGPNGVETVTVMGGWDQEAANKKTFGTFDPKATTPSLNYKPIGAPGASGAGAGLYDTYEAALAACQGKPTTGGGGDDGGEDGGGDGGSDFNSTTPKDPYLPYHGVQMAQTLDAFSRPVKGYFDRPFVPEYSGMNAMYDDPNYNPLLSANATKQEFMNQFGNAQAARASGTYNPDLMQGLIGETQRFRANNLNIFNTTEGQNNQMYNQNALNRAMTMKQVRDNNIRTREEMDIAEQLKFQNAMNAFGKMSGDRTEMMKYNVMYPQFAVTGRLWDKMPFVKGKPIGQQNSGNALSFASWLTSNPEYAEFFKTGTAKDKMEMRKLFETEQRQRQNMMYKNPQYVQANRFNRDFDQE